MKSLILNQGRAVTVAMKIHTVLWSVICLIFLSFLIVDNVAAQDCDGFTINGMASNQIEIQDVCNVAQQATDFLRQCGIESSEDFNITIQERLTHVSGLPVFAFFHSPNNQITITDFESFKNLIDVDSAYYKLPNDDLYKSLIAHEVTHAISLNCQIIAESDCSRVALEYIASVVQVASMNNNTRQILLSEFPRSSPVELEMFNEFVFYSSPQWFVANAYRHYKQIDNECEFLRNILKGEIQFLGGFDFE